MAQGKLKAKAKLPPNVIAKTYKGKGNAVTKRSNCPMKPKKKQHEETQKLKQIMTKTVNKTVEEEIRARAMGNQKKLSKVQEAVANYQEAKGGG